MPSLEFRPWDQTFLWFAVPQILLVRLSLLVWVASEQRVGGATVGARPPALVAFNSKFALILNAFLGVLAVIIPDIPGLTRVVVGIVLFLIAMLTIYGRPRAETIPSAMLITLAPVAVHILGWAYFVPRFLPTSSPLPGGSPLQVGFALGLPSGICVGLPIALLARRWTRMKEGKADIGDAIGFTVAFGTLYQLYGGYQLSRMLSHEWGDSLGRVLGASASSASRTVARATEIAFYEVGGGLAMKEGPLGALGRFLVYSPMVLVNTVAFCCGMLAMLVEPRTDVPRAPEPSRPRGRKKRR